MESFHQGKALKKAIAIHEDSVTEIAENIKVHRDTIYNLFKKEVIPESYLRMFEKVGIKIGPEPKIVDKSENAKLQRMQMEIDSQKELIESLRETIEAKNEAIAAKNIIIEASKKKATH